MFSYIDKLDKKLNRTHRNYFLTQGDSFSLEATPEIIVSDESEIIDKIVFKLGMPKGECEITSIFEKDFVKFGETYILKVTTEETTQWKSTCEMNDYPYIYEIEVVYTDGNTNTVEKAEFVVETQIGG